MPLVHSRSNKARDANIRTEIAAGRTIKQAVAIGYSEQRRAGRGHPTVEQVKADRRKRK